MDIWSQNWFRLIILLILIISIILNFFNRDFLPQKRNIKLKKLVSRRTVEIQSKNKELLKQKKELQELNQLLEKRQKRIEKQTLGLKKNEEQLEQLFIALKKENNLSIELIVSKDVKFGKIEFIFKKLRRHNLLRKCVISSESDEYIRSSIRAFNNTK